jgi:hypothetical protein
MRGVHSLDVGMGLQLTDEVSESRTVLVLKKESLGASTRRVEVVFLLALYSISAEGRDLSPIFGAITLFNTAIHPHGDDMAHC